MPDPCTWTWDHDEGCWVTGCGNAWEMTTGTPEDNGVRFCPFCGRPPEATHD